nr:hypothetical protein [Gammaproteobacteria bacterium]
QSTSELTDRSSIFSRSSFIDSASGQTGLIASQQSKYQYPQYPKSYRDFIPVFKARGTQTTVMLADLWQVLEKLIEDQFSMQAHESFSNIVDSLPDDLIPVRITNNKQDRMLVCPWYIFVDPDSTFTLRPFFQKAIIKSLEEDNHSYLNIINQQLEKISTSKKYSLRALRRPDVYYKATYNFNVSEEQLLATINTFLDSRYISLNQQQEDLAKLREEVTAKESHDQSELLRLNVSIDRKRAKCFQLKRELFENSSQPTEVKKENHIGRRFVDEEAEEIKKLEEKITKIRTRNGEIQDQILRLESRLRVIESDFNELEQAEHHQENAYEHEKQQYSESSKTTLWLAEKIEALRVELLQRSEKSDDVMTSPYAKDPNYTTPTKHKNNRSPRSESADSFSGDMRKITQSPIMQTTSAVPSPRVSSKKNLIRPATPPPPPRRSQLGFQPPPPPYPKAKVGDVVESHSPGTFNPTHTPSRGFSHTGGNPQQITHSPAIQRVQARLEENVFSSSHSQPSTMTRSPSWRPAPPSPRASQRGSQPPPPPPKNASTALSDHRPSLFAAITNPAGFPLRNASERVLAEKPPAQLGLLASFSQVIQDRRTHLSDESSVSSNSSFGSGK